MNQARRSHSVSVEVRAPAQEVFAFMDDHARLSSHMGRRSWALGGGAMTIEFDGGMGKTVGSTLRLRGIMLGMRLEVRETVVERAPPWRKIWETTGEPRLLVIGAYRMGFVIEEIVHASRLTVFIEFEPPRRAPSRWLGQLFGRWYARWCAESMALDTARHFRAARAAAGKAV